MRFCLRHAQILNVFVSLGADLNSSANFLLLYGFEVFSLLPIKLQWLSVLLFLVCLVCEGRRCAWGSTTAHFYNISPIPDFLAVKH